MSPEGGAEKPAAPETVRVFFALWPSPELANALAAIANEAVGHFGGRATRADSIHLTLAFLGELPVFCLPTLCEAATQIKTPSFVLTIDHLGFWSHNQLLWAGCSLVPPALSALVSDLQHRLAVAGFAVDRANRVFTPHVTLVRKVPLAKAPRHSDALPGIAPLAWPCGRWVLVRSGSAASGSHYQVIAEFPLLIE